MDLNMLGKLLEGSQGEQGSIGGEDANGILEEIIKGSSGKEGNSSYLKELLDNPLEAMEKMKS